MKNKLSIFLSMIVAVAVAAFAASADSLQPASRATTQGYWFTIYRVWDGVQSTAGAEKEVRYVTLGGAAVDTYQPSTQTGELANKFFWHAEPVAANTDKTGYYLKNNVTGRYLSAEIFENKSGDTSKWGYRLTNATSTANASTWNLPEVSAAGTLSGEITVEWISKPAGLGDNEPNIKNTTLAMSDKQYGKLWLVDPANNNATAEDASGIDDFKTQWTLQTAEAYYDEYLEEGEKKIESLTAIETLWDNKTAIDAAKKAVDDLRGQYNFPETSNSNIIGVLNNVTTKLNTAYNNLYASLTSQVVTLQANGGNLQIDNNAINNNGSDDLNAFWTIAKSGNGYTFRNEYQSVYLALIPAKDAVYEYGIEVTPAVPAHFGVASSATVFNLTPQDGGIVLSTGDYTFGVEPNVANNTETVYTVKAIGVDEATAAVNTGTDFNSQKQDALDFLSALINLANTSDNWTSEEDTFETTWKKLDNTELKAQGTTAIDIIKNARTQVNQINSTVNEAMTPMFFTTTDNGNMKYIAAGNASYDGFTLGGQETTFYYPVLTLVDENSTEKGKTLADAMWTFYYMGNGQARFFNSQDLYLTAPYYDSKTGQETNVTAAGNSATLFKLIGGQLTYDGGTLNLAGTTQLAIANAMKMPDASTDAYVDSEGETQPGSTTTFYRIASVGGGGVIGANLPGDPLLHTSSSLGSYWWLEEANDDPEPNSYYIHSVYPGYYLGSDYKLSTKATKWYIGENSATRSTNIANVFNGYESGLLIGTNKEPSNGTVIAAAPFTNAGNANPSLQNGRFSASNWEYTCWMFIEAKDQQTIIDEYVTNDFPWQKEALSTALFEISRQLPFAANSLSAAVAEIGEYEVEPGSTLSEQLQQVVEFNEILTWAQSEFDKEVIKNAVNHTYKIINYGRQSDMNSDCYLAGSGSALKFVSILDDSKDSEWVMKASGTKGVTVVNGNGRSLGSPYANGNVSSSTGTYRLSLNVWWTIFDTEGNEIGIQPWYSVPKAVKDKDGNDPENPGDEFYLSLSYGTGLENVNALGTGLAAVPGSKGGLCGSDLISPYAQWRFSTYNPAPDGIETIEDTTGLAEEVELYNLQGIRVNRADAAPGLYISRRADGTVVKVAIR